MKVYFLVFNIFGIGGTVKTVVNTVNHLCKNGFDVEIISARRSYDEPCFEVDSSIKITTLCDVRGRYKFQGMTNKERLLKKALTNVPSFLIHRSEDLYKDFSAYIDFKIIQKLKTIKEGIFITTIPSFNILSARFLPKKVIKIGQEHKELHLHSRALQKKTKSYEKLDALACLTNNAVDAYSKNIGNSVNVVHMPNGTPHINTKALLENKVVIAAGRLVYQKGFDDLIDAFRIVVDEYPDWQLHIYGDGELKSYLRDKIFEHELYNNVYLYPSTKNISEKIRDSSIYALTSRYEPFGMVIIESMVEGVPCVSYDCDGPRLIINHQKDGVLVESGDVNAFASELKKLIRNKSDRVDMGERAYQASKRFGLEEIGMRWVELISKITSQRKKSLSQNYI